MYVVHKKQLAHLVSVSLEARSTVRIFLLKADIVGLSLIYFGTMAHILGPIYLIECLPKVTVLNLGKT